MTQKSTFSYRLSDLPDATYPAFALKAGGDVRAAVQADAEHLPRALAELPPGSASVAIQFVYRPSSEGLGLQQRLAIYVVAQAHDDHAAAGLPILLDQGPFSQFYELDRVDEMPALWDSVGAACDVARHASVLEPTVTAELNSRALPVYVTMDPFQPNTDNDYLRLDRVLDRLEEPVMVEVCVEPADVSQELAVHTGYLRHLQQINRTWDDGDDGSFDLDWRSDRTGPGRSPYQIPKPLRQKDPLADDVLRRQQRFHESLTQRHLRFHIRVFAETPAVARLVASVVAESAFEEGSYMLVDTARDHPLFEEMQQALHSPSVVPVSALERALNGRPAGPYDGLSALTNLAPVEELSSAFRLPLASHGSPCCIRKNTDPPHEEADGLFVLGYDYQSRARSAANCRGVPRGVPIDALTKHLFVAGLPGAGKTTSMLNLLLQASQRGIPFVVFEPAKTEYRVLKCLREHGNSDVRRLSQELRIYTPGSEEVSPLRRNPLRVIEGIPRDQHIENILTCFKASMPMEGPLPALLGEALEQVYDDHEVPGNPPRMADLHRAAQEVLASKGYSGEVNSDLRAALEVRLGILTRRAIGRIFQCAQDAPTIGELMTSFSIVELASLPPEQACLLTLFILTAIREYVAVHPSRDGGIRLILVLEEAHNLVGRDRDAAASGENADPKAFASEFICRMLAELRALGVAIVIVDQLPSAIAPEVIKNTASKLAFRQVDNNDREVLGGSMLFGPIEIEEIARLRPGEAYLFTEGYFGPQRIRTPNLHAELDLPEPPVGGAIVPYLHDDPWFVDAANARVSAELDQLRREMDRFDAVRMRVAKRAAEIVARRPRALAHDRADDRDRHLSELAARAQSLRQQLGSAFKTFSRDVYRPLLGSEKQTTVVQEDLTTLRAQLVSRFESIITPDTQACLALLTRLTNECRPTATPTQGA